MARESSPRLLHEVFAQVLQKHAAARAVDVPPGVGRTRRTHRTYGELDRDAALVHAALGEDRGERVVALLLSRDTPWLYAAQLGVLRSGACYVALEGRNPDEHLRFVLHDAGAKVVLSDRNGCERLRPLVDHDVRVLDVEELAVVTSPPPFAGDDARLAYLIYTSGTTGRPKGVM
ncbi:MAG: AMP-binding protein, partial [Planctomycetota bacterium]